MQRITEYSQTSTKYIDGTEYVLMYINHNSLAQRRHHKGLSKVVPVHAITLYRETEVLFQSFLTSALDEGELGNDTAK